MGQTSKNTARQVKFYLSEEQYSKLKKIAEDLGLTVPAFVKNLALESIGEANYGNIVSNIKELEKKYNQLAKEVGRIEKDLAILIKYIKRKN